MSKNQKSSKTTKTNKTKNINQDSQDSQDNQNVDEKTNIFTMSEISSFDTAQGIITASLDYSSTGLIVCTDCVDFLSKTACAVKNKKGVLLYFHISQLHPLELKNSKNRNFKKSLKSDMVSPITPIIPITPIYTDKGNAHDQYKVLGHTWIMAKPSDSDLFYLIHSFPGKFLRKCGPTFTLERVGRLIKYCNALIDQGPTDKIVTKLAKYLDVPQFFLVVNGERATLNISLLPVSAEWNKLLPR